MVLYFLGKKYLLKNAVKFDYYSKHLLQSLFFNIMYRSTSLTSYLMSHS